MLKKIPNISNYCIFALISFFSLKRFLISLITVSFVSFLNFFNLKRFLTSLVMFSSVFLSSSIYELFLIICCEKK